MQCLFFPDCDGQLFLVTNGGSTADAQHSAAGLTRTLLARATTYPSNGPARKFVSPNSDRGDYGYEHVFKYSLANFPYMQSQGTYCLPSPLVETVRTFLKAIEMAHKIEGRSSWVYRWKNARSFSFIASVQRAYIKEMHITLGHAVARFCGQ